MATDDARLRDALQCAKVGRLAIARVLCYPARSVVAVARVSLDWNRDSAIIFMSPVAFPCLKKARRNSKNTTEILTLDKWADSLTHYI